MCEQMERIKTEGENNKAKDMAITLNKEGVDISIIAKSAKVSVERVKEWIKESN